LPFSAILTTNYDDLLERAYVMFNTTDRCNFVYVHNNFAQLPKLASEKKFFILKIHGDVNDIDSVVLTKTDYARMVYKNEAYRATISNIISTHTILFVGYGLGDYDLNLVLEEHAAIFRQYGKRHYAIIKNPGHIMSKSLYEHYNVTVIPYNDKEDFAGAERLLTGLRGCLDMACASANGDMKSKISEIMKFERKMCDYLNSLIEYDRAKYLKLYTEIADFGPDDKLLLDRSICHWEKNLHGEQSLVQQLQHAQKMEAVGRLAGGVAHDFNNILQSILGHAELVKAELPENDSRLSSVELIAEAAKRGAVLTRQLLTFSRKQVRNTKILDLNKAVENMAKMLQQLLGSNIELVLQLGEQDAFVIMDEGQFDQVILNLANNARDAMPQGGCLKLETGVVEIDEDPTLVNREQKKSSFVRLTITDSGVGMSDEVRSHVFEPFFTTKAKGEGTGLGLATVYGIVKQSDGWIEFDSEVGHGTSFRVFLPYGARLENKSKSVICPNVLGNNEVILVVDDEKSILHLIDLYLRDSNYKTLCTNDCCEALTLARNNKIDLLLTDIVMPNMDGFTLSMEMLKIHSRLRVVFMSGFSTAATNALRPSVIRKGEFLCKPFDKKTCLETIRNTLGAEFSRITKVRAKAPSLRKGLTKTQVKKSKRSL
jgi:signal transduction histidine kinase/FixJ family two-component response regulator